MHVCMCCRYTVQSWPPSQSMHGGCSREFNVHAFCQTAHLQKRNTKGQETAIMYMYMYDVHVAVRTGMRVRSPVLFSNEYSNFRSFVAPLIYTRQQEITKCTLSTITRLTHWQPSTPLPERPACVQQDALISVIHNTCFIPVYPRPGRPQGDEHRNNKFVNIDPKGTHVLMQNPETGHAVKLAHLYTI